MGNKKNNDLDFIKKEFFVDFSQVPSFSIELFKKIEQCIKNNINIKDYERRLVLYNSFKYLKDLMITNIKNITISEDRYYINVDYEVFSLNAGIYSENKKIFLSLLF